MKSSKGFAIVEVLVIVVVLIVLGSGVWIWQKGKLEQSPVVNPRLSTSQTSQAVTVMTNSGLTFSIPKSWGGRFYKNSTNELRVELSDWIRPEVKEGTQSITPSNYIQVDIFTTSKPLANKYVTLIKSENITVNGLSIKKSVGKETFSAKGRDHEQFSWGDKSKTYVLAAYSPDIKNYESAIIALIQSIGKNKTSASSQSSPNIFSGSVVYAQEPTTQSGTTTEKFPGITFKELLSEAAPLEAQFTENDGKWKENRAQGYTFTALVDQRLTTLATEEAGYSFIKSDLYDESGQLVKGGLDTRIEFTVPKTGKYFFIVQNSKNGTEKYNVRLQDRDQSDIVIKVKRYSDGAEFFFPPEVDVVTIPFSDLAFLVNLNKVMNPSSIAPVVYTQSGTREQFKEKAFFPEDSQGNIAKTTPFHLDNGAILVEPESKSYPAGSQNVLLFSLGSNAGYIYRIFTQSVTSTSPTLAPTPNQIGEKICRDEQDLILQVVSQFEELQKQRDAKRVLSLFTSPLTDDEKNTHTFLSGSDAAGPRLYNSGQTNFKQESYMVAFGPGLDSRQPNRCTVTVREQRQYYRQGIGGYLDPTTYTLQVVLKKDGVSWLIDKYINYEVGDEKYSGW